jgi:general secretion pathway protein E
MNSPREEGVPTDSQEREVLLAQARALAAAGGGLPVVMAALQADFGQREEVAGDLTAEVFGLRAISLAEMSEHSLALSLAPFAEFIRRQALVLEAGDAYLIATPNPFDAGVRDWLEGLVPLGRLLHWRLAPPSVLTAFLAREESRVRALDGSLSGEGGQIAIGSVAEDLSLQRISEDGSAVVRLLRSTLHDGLKAGASDIHIEANNRGLAIKYRIDGVLNYAGAIDGNETAEQMISRVKVLSELDISERRVPQDGRFKVSWQGREIDIRVSIMPSIWGEDAVLRVLDKQALTDHLQGLRLDAMGFDADIMARIRRLASEPYGMVLVTGPTGSGKTTTLYAALSEINRGEDKIITIEDPVEYQLSGVLQIPVNEKRPDLRPRPALHPAPRPGQDHGRRDPRCRNRADRRPGRADRPPRIHHGARQQCVRRDRPFPAHGSRSLQPRLGAQRRRRTAPDPHIVSGLHAARAPDGRRVEPCRHRSRCQRRLEVPPLGGLRRLSWYRLSWSQSHRGIARAQR